MRVVFLQRRASSTSLARASSHPPAPFSLRKLLAFRISPTLTVDSWRHSAPRPMPSSVARKAARTRVRHGPVTAYAAPSTTLNKHESGSLRSGPSRMVHTYGAVRAPECSLACCRVSRTLATNTHGRKEGILENRIS
jgi:hypothetical protein